MAKFVPKPPAAGRNGFDVKREGTKIDMTKIDKASNSIWTTSMWDYPKASSETAKSINSEAMKAYYDYFNKSFSYGAEYGRSEQKDGGNYELSAAREKVQKYIVEPAYGVAWDDVVGNIDARTALLDAIEGPKKNKAMYEKYGIKPAKGVLLYGPPGCGKTMFGKAAASALGSLYGSRTELLVINGAEIQSAYVGETEKVIGNIFAYARAFKKSKGFPLVIFIDEADAILPSRERSYRYEATQVARFLTEIDGMNENGAFVILATNRPDDMDEALLRDGRCDRKIRVNRPTYEDAKILAHKAIEGKPWNAAKADDLVDYLFDATHLLRALENAELGTRHHFLLSHIVSGAMIVGLVERAKMYAMKRELDGGEAGVSRADFISAVDAALMENKGLSHDYALREFVETVAIPFEKTRMMN